MKSEKHMDFLISIWPNPVSVILNLNNKTKNILKEILLLSEFLITGSVRNYYLK